MSNVFTAPENWIGNPITVLLIGAGGSGSQIAAELAQMDFLLRAVSNGRTYLKVTIADGDTVSQFNVGRQCFYLPDVGFNKAEVLTHRFNAFSGTCWNCKPQYLEQSDLAGMCMQYDLLITAVDKAKFRYDLGKEWHQKYSRCLWIDVGNSATDGQVILGHLGKTSGKRLPNIFDLYGEQLAQAEMDDQPSCSTEAALQKQSFGVNRGVVAQATQLIWQLLRNGEIHHHGAFVDVAGACVNPMPISPETWSVYGYQADDWAA